MNASTLWGLGIAGLTIVIGYIAAKVTGKATVAAAQTSADEDAFVRAKDIYESSIREYRERLEELARRIEGVENDLRAARTEVSTLRRSVSQYEGRVIQLTEVLRLHNIDVPPWTLNPSDYGMLPGSIPDPNQPARTNET